MLLIQIHICPPQLSHCHLLVVNVVLDQCKVGSLCSVGCSTSTVLYIKYVYINYSINPNQNNLRSITVASFMHPAPLQPPQKKRVNYKLEYCASVRKQIKSPYIF